MPRYLILNGPNLNRLGVREQSVYGNGSLEDLERDLLDWGREKGLELECRQSNIEGHLIDWLQGAESDCAGVVINPGGYSHTSVALRDCIAALRIPVIEVHISNIHAREPYRRRSLTGEAARGVITGLGADGYKLALTHLSGA